MSKIDETTIENIRIKNEIVSTISNYVNLTKKGKNYVGICPFHNDTSPSMVVSQEKQIYKCFSCGAGGNVIGFVKDIEKISFLEALQKLAINANIELDIQPTQTTRKEEDLKKFEEYYQINEVAQQLFKYMLREYDNMKGYNYLKSRKMNDEVIEAFNLGYVSSEEVLAKLISNKELSLNKAVELGLLKINHNNEYKSVYANRITYPIYNINNNLVGFSCRLIEGDGPKYINSPASELFNKSVILYNLNNALEHVKQSHELFLLEGPNDCIAFYKAGIKNSACVLGTAFTKEHVAVLKRIGITCVILGFDGDEAGVNATIKTMSILRENKIKVKILDFESYDPDEYLNEYGYEKFNSVIKNPLEAMEFKMKYYFSNINTNNYEDRKKIVTSLALEISQNYDSLDQEYYINLLSQQSMFSPEIIKSYLQQNTRNDYTQKTQQIVKSQIQVSDAITRASEYVIYYMMQDHTYYQQFIDKIGTFLDAKYRRMANIIGAFYLKNDHFEIASMYDKDMDEEVLKDLNKIALTYHIDEKNKQVIFDDCLSSIKLDTLKKEIDILNKELIHNQNPIEKAEVSSKIINLTMQINSINKSKYNK